MPTYWASCDSRALAAVAPAVARVEQQQRQQQSQECFARRLHCVSVRSARLSVHSVQARLWLLSGRYSGPTVSKHISALCTPPLLCVRAVDSRELAVLLPGLPGLLAIIASQIIHGRDPRGTMPAVAVKMMLVQQQHHRSQASRRQQQQGEESALNSSLELRRLEGTVTAAADGRSLLVTYWRS
jgi:hypothetical protein